jgi:hypothetical protein
MLALASRATTLLAVEAVVASTVAVTAVPPLNEVPVKYVPKVKYDISFPDTSIYCFSNTFQDGGYPLSEYMDSLWKSNLVSVRFVYNQSRYNLTGATIPYREFAVEKKEIKLENENEIIEFVERFAKEHKE